eukprot:11205901-Lingulodinium_polyedra.AAC.1
MMRSNRRLAVAAVRAPRVRAFQAQTEDWSARGVRECAICEPLRQQGVDSTASSRGISKTLRIGAVGL